MPLTSSGRFEFRCTNEAGIETSLMLYSRLKVNIVCFLDVNVKQFFDIKHGSTGLTLEFVTLMIMKFHWMQRIKDHSTDTAGIP
jgi:hypothetical protein